MVSIIIPVYNCQEFLEECIQSVLRQTYLDWELIIIDDFSTDSSRDIINKYAQIDSRIKFYFFDKNKGAGIARNKGIEISKMRFIAFLDSDDYWHQEKLKRQLNYMIQNEVEFCYTRFFELNSSDEPSKVILPPTTINTFTLLFNNYIKTLTAIYDSKRIGKIYMPEYRKRQDWGLWFNILNRVDKAYCFSEPLAYYRTSNNSLSKNKFQLLKENFNFYRSFLNKSAIVSVVMLILFLCVHLSYKWTSFSNISK